MTNIIFVMGMSGAGKSTFIKENFPNAFILDLLDFQKKVWSNHIFPTYDMVMKSYLDLRDELLSQINNHETIVVEHTLLRAERREIYLNALKNKNVKVIGYFLDIDKKDFFKRNPDRHINHYTNSKDILEFPTIEEGFNEVFII